MLVVMLLPVAAQQLHTILVVPTITLSKLLDAAKMF